MYQEVGDQVLISNAIQPRTESFYLLFVHYFNVNSIICVEVMFLVSLNRRFM